jgi:ABC-2 type transport system permease protein
MTHSVALGPDASAGQWARAVRAETRKLLGLRSTWLILGLANLAGLLIGVLTLHSTAASWSTLSPSDRAAFDPTADAFTGFQFTQLALAAWGVLAATGEYAHRTIDSTLTAVPRRGIVFTAKLAVVALVSLPLSLVSVAVTWAVGQVVLHRSALDAALSDPGVVRAVLCAGLFLTAVTVLGFGLGVLLRHTAVALCVLFGLLFLAWPAARAVEGFSYLPDRWLLVNAADALVTTHPITGPNAVRTPGVSAAALEILVYLVVVLGLGAGRNRHDP